jgi:hypothetical protein
MSFDNQFEDNVFSPSEVSPENSQQDSQHVVSESSQEALPEQKSASYWYERRQQQKQERLERQQKEQQTTAEKEELERLKKEIEDLKNQVNAPKQEQELNALIEEYDQLIVDSPAKGVAQLVNFLTQKQQEAGPKAQAEPEQHLDDVFESVMLPYYEQVVQSDEFKGFAEAENAIGLILDNPSLPNVIKQQAEYVASQFEVLEEQASKATSNAISQYKTLKANAVTPMQRQQLDDKFNSHLNKVASALVEEKLKVFNSPKGLALVQEVEKLAQNDTPQNTRQQLAKESKSPQRTKAQQVNLLVARGFTY